jgi:hypothetical protein
MNLPEGRKTWVCVSDIAKLGQCLIEPLDVVRCKPIVGSSKM